MQEHLVNDEIRARNIRLISSDGEQLGIVSIREARRVAEEEGLDLVQVSSNDPPTCKIMDYSKFKFEQKKKAKEQKRNQTIIEIKEVQITQRTAENDMRIKGSQIGKFLQKGNHVRITLKLRGREMSHPELGIEAMNEFLELLTSMEITYKVKQNVKLNGRQIECSILPE